MLRIRVLGELALEIDGTPLDPPASRRARALVGLLAVERRLHARSELAARFWPDVLDESARTSLRAALSALRRALGPDADRYLVATRERVALAEGVWTDAGEFERLAEQGRPADAVALWRGDFLSGLDDDWILAAREEWRERLRTQLRRLADAAEAAGDLRAAVERTRQMVAADPLAEEGQRELIRRLASAGDRAAAVAAYNRYADRLRTELRIAPSAATRALVEELRAEPEPPVEPPAPDPGPGPAPARTSGTVTLLFTDLVGSTELLDQLGDEEAERLRRIHFGLLREVALQHAGQEVKSLGDGLMVAFASSVDATACAVAIQQAVHRHNERERAARLQVRVGLNVGEPIREEDDYFGTPVVVAKRLCDRAQGGQILASDLVRLLVGSRGGFRFRPVGDLALKGLREPVPSCEVAWEAAGRHDLPLPAELRREQGPLVGREQELRALEGCWQATRGGRPVVAAVGGEPGIGKTRLVAELCRRAHDQGATVLLGRSYEQGLIPYQPFVEALRQYVEACPVEELRLQLGTRRPVLAKLVPELGAPPAGTTEGRDEGEAERYALFDAVASFLRQAATSRPTILVLDDLHWADESSLLLLRHLARSVGGEPLLIAGTYRETEVREGDPLAGALAELRRARMLETVSLSGLDAGEVGELIRGRVTGASEAMVRAVVDRTEGNPFFVEEILHQLGDTPTDEVAVPQSVKDLLLRRLRGLEEPARRMLAAAAVLGRDFDMDVVHAMVDIDEDSLLDLVDTALAERVIVESPEAPGRCSFAHALIRETLYDQLSGPRRTRLHGSAGEALSRLADRRADERAAEIAHHFTRAGDDRQAFDHAVRAARTAAAVHATEAALGHFHTALEAGGRLGLTAESDERVRRLLLERGGVRHRSGDVRGGSADARATVDAARTAGDQRMEVEALIALALTEKGADREAAERHLRAALELAPALDDASLEVQVLGELSLLRSRQLDFASAVEMGDRALELARHSGGERDRARAIDALKLTAVQLGDLERLERLTAELEDIERRHGDLWYLQWTLLEASFVGLGRAEWPVARDRLEEALTISRRIGEGWCRPLIHDARGWLHRSRGDYRAALREGHEAVELAERYTAGAWAPWTRATLAWTLLELRAGDEAVAVLRPAVEQATTLGDRLRAAAHLAWACTLAGAGDAAERAAAEADELLAHLMAPPGAAFLFGFGALAALARAHLAGGRIERAEALVSGPLAVAERSGWQEAAASLALVLCLCREANGDAEQARELAARATAVADRHGFVGVAWEAHAALDRLGDGAPDGRGSAPDVAAIAAGIGDARLAELFLRAVRG